MQLAGGERNEFAICQPECPPLIKKSKFFECTRWRIVGYISRYMEEKGIVVKKG